jgi:tRNA(His) guanylyltransferase
MQFILQSDDVVELGSNKTLSTDQFQSPAPENRTQTTRKKIKQKKSLSTRIDLLHCDLIKDEFWDNRPWLSSD